VPGFSRLGEAQIPAFIGAFLGSIADLIRSTPDAPLTKNTWGDGLYFVFRDVGDAARFALDLRDRVEATDWEARGLPGSLSLRIALHAGPVYPCVDPVIAQPSFTGAHVSQTARIEPITPPGEVYASEAFSALAETAGVEGVAFEYVGRTPFAKGYGTGPVYHVRRA